MGERCSALLSGSLGSRREAVPGVPLLRRKLRGKRSSPWHQAILWGCGGSHRC